MKKIPGFRITISIQTNLGVEERNCFLDRFTEQAIEANHLLFGGGGDDSLWQGCTEPDYDFGNEITEEQRQAVIIWLQQAPEVTSFEVGEIHEEEPIDDAFVKKLEEITQAFERKAPFIEIEKLFDEL